MNHDFIREYCFLIHYYYFCPSNGKYIKAINGSKTMNYIQKRFYLYAIIVLAVTIFVSQILFSTIFETNIFPERIISIGFVWLTTCTSHFWVIKTLTDKPKAFNRVFMLLTIIKLMLYMTYIIVYLFFFRQHGVLFTAHFLVVYIVFAIFEVTSILKIIKKIKPDKCPETLKIKLIT